MMETLGTFKSLENLIATDEIITTDKYLAACSNNENLEYIKRDFLFVPGSFRGDRQLGILKGRGVYKNKVLVIGHSDIATRKSTVRIVKCLGSKFTFGVNTFPVREVSESLPLGVMNYCDDTPAHRILGNPDHLLVADKSSFFVTKFSPEFYINFTLENNIETRRQVMSELGKLSKSIRIKFDKPEFSSKKRIEFLRNLRSTTMTICPEGNGVDTHRLWETLYMGGVPVIIFNPLIHNLVVDLPVIVLRSWSQLNDIDSLNLQWESIQSRRWNYRKITSSYWTDLIIARAGN